MHATITNKINHFMIQKCIPDQEAFACWIHAAGIERASQEANIETSILELICNNYLPSQEVLQSVPEIFSFGLDSSINVDAEADRSDIESLEIDSSQTLPKSYEIDLPRIDESTNQGNIGSCVAWAGAHTIEAIVEAVDNNPTWKANPSAIYGIIKGERLDHIPDKHGSTLEALSKALTTYGSPAWDFMKVHRESPENNPGNLPLPSGVLSQAKENRCFETYWIKNWTHASIQQAMHLMKGNYSLSPSRSLPICTAFFIPASFFNAYTYRTGIVMMPPANDAIRGGHAVVFVGWKIINDQTYLIVKNSWGTRFGDNGYLYFPFAFVEKFFKPSFVIHELRREKQQRERTESFYFPFKSIAIAAALTLMFTLGYNLFHKTQQDSSALPKAKPVATLAKSPTVFAQNNLKILPVSQAMEPIQNESAEKTSGVPIIANPSRQAMEIYEEIIEMTNPTH